MNEQTPTVTMEKIVSLARRRGFVFPSSEIYGGLSGCWDYGPLGIELKRNVKQAWWSAMVQERDDMVGIESSILMHPKVWVASGHLKGFSDPLVECKSCHQRFRVDELAGPKCSACGGEFTEERQFNLMFKTFIGPVEDGSNVIYLRPETAQGMFVNFDNILQSTRRKVPFGIAQQGKSFRNEITTGNFIFRSREFEQMEIEYFVKPGTDEKWFEFWLNERLQWYVKYGIKREHLSILEHEKAKLAHYAKRVCDITFQYPMGWEEIEGIANRTNFDLKQHAEASGKVLDYYDDETKEHYIPYVIEPSAGVDRSLLAFMCDAYAEEPDKDETRVIMHFHPSLAPVKAAILPLSKKGNLSNFTRDIYKNLRTTLATQYDDTQSIGRRYRRQDEIGTPYCITVDFQSLEDNRVTVRERDSMGQIRIPIIELKKTLEAKIAGEDFLVLPPGGEVVQSKGKEA